MRIKSIAKSNPVFDVTSNPLRTGNDAPCEVLTLTLTMSKTNELYCPLVHIQGGSKKSIITKWFKTFIIY